MTERVLVVPRAVLFPGGSAGPAGFASGGERFLEAVARHGFFELRDEAERSPSLKQIIPYGILVHDRKVFVMRRSRKGGEARLHEKVTLGVGGHVNPEDEDGGDLRSAVERAFLRELHEELVVETPWKDEVVGVLNDDSNSVGSVHFGIVHMLVLSEPRVRVREDELLSGEFVPVDRLPAQSEHMETWSQILQRHFWP
jgi:predicted NUDIX family phosphoesterase